MADSTGKTYQQVAPTDFSAANRLMNDAMKQQMLGGLMLGKAFTEGGQILQDRRDADYYSQLNQYANDPLGMAQALQDGTINSSGISDAASKATAEYFNKAATNWKSNTETEKAQYIQDQYRQHKGTLDAIYSAGQSGNEAAYNAGIQQFIKNGGDVQVLKDLGLNYDKQKAEAALMGARAAMAGLANEERKKMSYDRYIEFLDKHSRTATNDPNFRIFDYLDTLSPSEKAYYMEGIQGGSNVWNGLLAQGILSANGLGSATPSSTTNGASYDDGNLQFGK
jgi:hypothetical protein